MHRIRNFTSRLLIAVSSVGFLHPQGLNQLNAIERINYESLRVSKIIVKEDGGISAQTKSLMSTLKTKEGEYFSQKDFDEDLKLLADDFAQVIPAFEVKDGALVISLDMSKRPIIHSITFNGNQEIETDKLEKELGISPKTVFDRQAFVKAFNKLRAYYIKKGYFEAKLSYEQKPAKEKGEIDIIITIHEGRGGVIEDIRFINFTDVEQRLLEDRLMTKPYQWWWSWFSNEGYYNKEITQQDELGVLGLLHNEGYADATVDVRVLPSPDKKDRIIIEFSCNRGALYSISGINVRGNTLFSTDEILKELDIKKDSPYSPDELRRAARAVYQLYGQKGYADALITPESKLDLKSRTYDVTFVINEGKQFRVGMIKIFGNTRTDASVILHETPLYPGEVFDTTMLLKTEERLRNVGYFKTVNIYAVRTSQVQSVVAPSSSDVQFRDIHIEVDEKTNTANFNAFGGYSTTESIVGGLGVNETNFKMAGIPKIFSEGFRAIRGGGEYCGFNMQVGTKQLQYNLNWSKPYFMDTKWIVGVDLQKMRNSYSASDYTLKTESATITANYPINAYVKTGGQYRIRNSEVSLKGIKHNHRNRELIRESHNGGLISAVGVNWMYDNTNNPYTPSSGIRSNVSVEFAGVGGDHRFLNFGYNNTLFWAPFSHGIFKFRGNINFIQTLFGTKPSKLPLDERLYLGGETSMRGYKFNTVGPRFHDDKHTPRGGMSSVLFSGEYDYPIMKRLSVFVFADIGNVYFSQFTVGKLRYTTGFGAKFMISEHAPLVFGLGYPLNPQSNADIQRFFFSIGTSM